MLATDLVTPRTYTAQFQQKAFVFEDEEPDHETYMMEIE